VKASKQNPNKVRRGLVLGCGGTLGAAWTIATLFEVAEQLAWDPRTADLIVGTSAGSELAMLLGAGVSVSRLLDAQLGASDADPVLARHFANPPPTWPRLRLARPASLARVADLARGGSLLTAVTGVFPDGRGDPSATRALVDAYVPAGGWVPHRGTRIAAADFDTTKRVLFGGPRAPQASMRDAVCASFAMPAFFPAVNIAGRRYTDAGIVSPASVDLAVEEGLDEVIVLAPMSSTDPGPRRGLGRVEGLARAAMRKALDKEIALARELGARVLRIEPTAEDLAVMGPVFMDGARRLGTVESTLRTARRTVRAALARDGAFAPVSPRVEGAIAWQA
jgi:NTE family protein